MVSRFFYHQVNDFLSYLLKIISPSSLIALPAYTIITQIAHDHSKKLHTGFVLSLDVWTALFC